MGMMLEKTVVKEKKWHSMNVASVLEELKTSREKGLSEEEAKNRLKNSEKINFLRRKIKMS